MLQAFVNYVECISDQSSNISLIIQTSPNHTLLLTTTTSADNGNTNNKKIIDNILQSNNIKSIIDHSTLSSYIRNSNEKKINSNDISNTISNENSNSCANIKISIQQTLFLLLTLLITICSFFI
ncbi:hypothetical protein ACTA71_001245 [Dictyostelium dimigraforme]